MHFISLFSVLFSELLNMLCLSFLHVFVVMIIYIYSAFFSLHLVHFMHITYF